MHCTVPDINEGLEVLQVGEVPEVPGVVPDCLGGECCRTGNRFQEAGSWHQVLSIGNWVSGFPGDPGVLRVCWICR